MKTNIAQSSPTGPLAQTIFVIVAALVAIGSLGAGGQSESGGVEAVPPAATAEAPDLTGSARIVFLIGEVLVDGEEAQIGDNVGPGSVVVTGPDGEVDLTFGTGNALRIEQNTELTLDLSDPSIGIDLRRGTIAAVFEGLATIGTDESDTFRIATPSTVAGVRGTAFFVHIESDDQTYVCTCRGILEFEETGLVVRAARHDATRFTRTADGVIATSAPEIYHDTASLNRVADVAGVTIEWGVEPED